MNRSERAIICESVNKGFSSNFFLSLIISFIYCSTSAFLLNKIYFIESGDKINLHKVSFSLRNFFQFSIKHGDWKGKKDLYNVVCAIRRPNLFSEENYKTNRIFPLLPFVSVAISWPAKEFYSISYDQFINKKFLCTSY